MSLFSSKPKPDPLAFLAEYSDAELIHALATVDSFMANAKNAFETHKELFTKVIAALKTIWTGIAFSIMTATDDDRERIVQSLAEKHPQIARVAKLYETHFMTAQQGVSDGRSTAS